MTEESTQTNAKKIIISNIVAFIIIAVLLMIFQPDPRLRLASVEIMLLFFYPLIIFYYGNNWYRLNWIINIVIISILYIFFAPIIHESCHILGLYIVGSKPIDFNLIPKFWEGQFTRAGWVRSVPLNNWLDAIPGLFPYIIDLCLIFIGAIILRTKNITNSFWAGLIYAFFCLAPLFDIVNNYTLKVVGVVEGNDFNGVALVWGEFWANFVGSVFSSIALVISAWVLLLYKGVPQKN